MCRPSMSASYIHLDQTHKHERAAWTDHPERTAAAEDLQVLYLEQQLDRFLPRRTGAH